MQNHILPELGQALRWGVDNGYGMPILKQMAMERTRQELRFLTVEE